jgi:hypothetical protein
VNIDVDRNILKDEMLAELGADVLADFGSQRRLSTPRSSSIRPSGSSFLQTSSNPVIHSLGRKVRTAVIACRINRPRPSYNSMEGFPRSSPYTSNRQPHNVRSCKSGGFQVDRAKRKCLRQFAAKAKSRKFLRKPACVLCRVTPWGSALNDSLRFLLGC